MTYVKTPPKTQTFLGEFCGEYLREFLRETLSAKSSQKIPQTAIDEVATLPEERLTLFAYVMDWLCLRDSRPFPYFFSTGKWFWMPERKMALPVEAMPGMFFTPVNTELDFPYVHSSYYDPERTLTTYSVDIRSKVSGRFRTQIGPMLVEGVSLDTALVRLADSCFPTYLYKSNPDFVWYIDLFLSIKTYNKLSKASRNTHV